MFLPIGPSEDADHWAQKYVARHPVMHVPFVDRRITKQMCSRPRGLHKKLKQRIAQAHAKPQLLVSEWHFV
eukprot:3056956-Amphidinium_carterae.2